LKEEEVVVNEVEKMDLKSIQGALKNTEVEFRVY
jgi:hypothetical protein